MGKLLLSSYMLLFIGLLCCSVTKQEVVNGEQLQQAKEEPIKPSNIFKYFHIIDVPKKPCPKNQRRDIFGNCRSIFNSVTQQEVDDDEQLQQELIKANDVSNFLHIIDAPIKKACLDNLKKDIFEDCRPTSNSQIIQEMDNVERLNPETEKPTKLYDIDVTIRPCPENQKRDISGECRTISNYDTKQEVDNDEQLMEDKDDLKFFPIIIVPDKPCPPNQKRDIFGRCRPTANSKIKQEEVDDDDQQTQDKQEPTKPHDNGLNYLRVIDVSIRPCSENQKRDLLSKCRPKSKYEINQEVENGEDRMPVNEEPIKRRNVFSLYHIISVPIKSCPENQKRDIFGNCRPIFN